MYKLLNAAFFGEEWLFSQLEFFSRNQEYFTMVTCTFLQMLRVIVVSSFYSRCHCNKTAFFVFLFCLLMWLKTVKLFPQHLVRASSLNASVIVCGLEGVTVKCKMYHEAERGVSGWDCRADPGMGQDLCSWSIRLCCRSTWTIPHRLLLFPGRSRMWRLCTAPCGSPCAALPAGTARPSSPTTTSASTVSGLCIDSSWDSSARKQQSLGNPPQVLACLCASDDVRWHLTLTASVILRFFLSLLSK